MPFYGVLPDAFGHLSLRSAAAADTTARRGRPAVWDHGPQPGTEPTQYHSQEHKEHRHGRRDERPRLDARGSALTQPGCWPGAPSRSRSIPAVCLLAALLYVLGVWRLHRRGDRWPPGRTLAFLAGVATIVEVTATGIGGYGMQLMSVHMVQHMVLSMVSPVLLLLGAPITLALRALPAAPHGRLRPARSARPRPALARRAR